MLKERMTPEEIAHLTGFSRQTINKWVRKEGGKPPRAPAFRAVKRASYMSMSRFANSYAARSAWPKPGPLLRNG